MQELLKNDSKYNGRWTKEEHLKFLQGLRIYGKNWKKIEQLVQSRNGSQIRSHAQKFFLKNNTSQPQQWNDFHHPSAQFQEQHEQITGNSKSVGEAALRREDFSYYFEKIVEYSSGKSSLNFWEALVDCKGATDISKHQNRKNSFTNFGDEEESLSVEDLGHKKVKV